MEKQTPIPPELKDEAAQKPKRAIFSPFGPRREKKTKESLPLRLWNLNSPPPPIERRSRYVTLPW